MTQHGSKHHIWSFEVTFVLQTSLYLGSFFVKTLGVLMLHLELWMIGEDEHMVPNIIIYHLDQFLFSNYRSKRL